jgi:uncharacterized protein (TIGR00290 family)
MENKIWFVSWSSGKDSCLALYEALKEKKKVNFLLNFAIDGKVHGINREIIETQAEAIGIPLVQKITTWENYEKNFDEEVLKLKEKGITGIIAGDIDLEEHLEWIKRKSKELCIDYYEPLWKRKREEILNEFVSDGFQAVVVCCIEKAKFLIGKEINKFTLEDFIKVTKENGIDSCGENGEFHTLVIDGPIFNKRLEIIESCEKEINEVRYGKKFILDIKKWKLKRKK